MEKTHVVQQCVTDHVVEASRRACRGESGSDAWVEEDKASSRRMGANIRTDIREDAKQEEESIPHCVSSHHLLPHGSLVLVAFLSLVILVSAFFLVIAAAS